MIDEGSFRRDLEMIAEHNGVPFGRLCTYWTAESEHINEMQSRHPGTLMLTRAYQCLFLETVEALNRIGPSCPENTELPFYTRFIPKLVYCFQYLCGADLLATHGYPLQGYAQLRNIADSLLMISAAMQGLVTLFELEGYNPQSRYEMKQAKESRRNTERDLWKKLTGTNSGLSDETVRNLRLWNDIFDLEVHGARLTFAGAIGWITGSTPLDVYPKYQQLGSVSYANRVCEVTWMALRLLPLVQHSALRFSEDWQKKWRILNARFRDTILHFANHQEQKLGLAIIELVQVKFPFDEKSLFPLEGPMLSGPANDGTL